MWPTGPESQPEHALRVPEVRAWNVCCGFSFELVSLIESLKSEEMPWLTGYLLWAHASPLYPQDGCALRWGVGGGRLCSSGPHAKLGVQTA